MDIIKAVFPIAGRAPIVIRSPFCHPEVILSNLVNPVFNPLIPSAFTAVFCIERYASSISGFICVYPLFEVGEAILVNSCFTKEIYSSIFVVSSFALILT